MLDFLIEFPEWLMFNFSDFIDRAFVWFRSTFSFLFEFIRTVLLRSLDSVAAILNSTPWFIWVLAIAGYYAIDYFTKRKGIAWLTVAGVLVLWLIYYNAILINPHFVQMVREMESIPWWFIEQPRTPWTIYIVLVFLGAYSLTEWKTALLLSVLLFLIGAFGVWDAMVYTLGIIVISVFISFIIGLPLGILMAKSLVVEKILRPILDLMQTIPSFVYLIPAVMLFQQGRVPATFATIIYSVPPLIRLTFLGIQNIESDVVEAGEAFGSTPRQMLFKIEIPQALSTIATGLNQTTMMAVAMVVIASLIGADGLGRIVLIANRQIQIGEGFTAGFAIVFLAIILDRLLQGMANKLEYSEAGIDE